MAKKAKVKQAAPEYPVPQDRDEVNDAIHRIGEHQRDVTRLEAELNDKLAVLKAEYELLADPHRQEMKALAAGVQTWCDANRVAITDNGKVKYARFASGEVNWRTGQPAVKVKKGLGDALLELLKSRGLGRFVRTKEELNKEAILMEPEKIKGMREVEVVQAESFSITPFETKLEQVL